MRKICLLSIFVIGIFPRLSADNITLGNNGLSVSFMARGNYILNSMLLKNTSKENSILKKMELIFHYNTSEGFYYIGESNTESRFGKNSRNFCFKTTLLSEKGTHFRLKEKNNNFEIERTCELKTAPQRLQINYKMLILKNTFLGPHSLCPAMTFDLRQPLIIFPGKKITEDGIKWSLNITSEESVRTYNWAIIFDKASGNGVVIKAPKISINIFRHKKIASNQQPVWIAALKPGFLKAHYLAANTSHEISFSLQPFIGDYSVEAAALLTAQNKNSTETKNKGTLLLNNSALSIWTMKPGKPIVRTAFPPDNKKTTELSISGAGNEAVTVPIVLRNKSAQPFKIKIANSDLKNGSNGKRIPVNNVSWRKGEWFKVKSPSYSESIIGEVPDALTEADSLDLAPGRNVLIWLKISVPSETEKGIYRGKIFFRNGKKLVSELPIKLEVFGFSLPEKRNFPCWTPVWQRELNKVYGPVKAKKISSLYL